MKRLNGAILSFALVVVLGVSALAGCAPKQSVPSGEPTSSVEVTEMTFKWSESTDCGACHATQKAAHVVGHETVACVDCHSDSASLEKAHANVTLEDTAGAKRLKSTKVEMEACLACHAADYTPEAVAGFTGCVGAGGAVTNPHDLPQIIDHEDIRCSSCHPEHSGLTPAEVAPQLCENCHE